MSEMSLEFMPERRDYGTGAFVRSLAISSPQSGRVSLAMEDAVHAFSIDFEHQRGVVRHVDARWERHPMSSCGGSSAALRGMEGCALSSDLFDITRHTDASQQCTHMYDMLCLAIKHAHEQLPDCRYDVVIPDAIDAPVTATLYKDGAEVLSLQLRDYENIVAPETYAGLSVFKGFMGWVRKNRPQTEWVHHFLIQKAVFVGRVQTMDAEAMIGMSSRLSGPNDGTCFGSQTERYAEAVRVGEIRRFERDSAPQLLRFFKPT